MEGCMELLPDDLLADMLQRVAPRGLATSRCVCRAWCTLIDDRRLLRSDLLPHSLAGLFVNYNELRFPDLFRRPCMDFRDYYKPKAHVLDHCNGVLLLAGGLLNPATGWWAPLRKFPPPRMGMEPYCNADMHLVFDPAVSPHCEVFLIPRVSDWDDVERATLETEWPPSSFILNVFSTVTGQWTERVLIREGEAIGTVAEMRCDERWDHPRPAAYWRGALYIRCEKDFIMRISLSNHTYRVIKPPCVIDEWTDIHLERSEKGVYFAFLHDEVQLRVWVLDESCSPMEWVLKHNKGVGFAQPSPNYVNGPWTLENTNREKGDYYIEAPTEQEYEWDSDDEGVVKPQDKDNENLHYQRFGILRFHPYKEIIFLNESLFRGLAYHLNSSKLEILGDMCPKYYSKWIMHRFMKACFPYTPCMMGELPRRQGVVHS